VNLPDAADEPARRAVFGDFVLDPQAPVDALCAFYGLPEPGATLSVGRWLEERIGRPAVVGDSVDWGDARFAVRAMDGARVAAVGLILDAGR
jgi:potassium/hydrogen antiporter